MADTIKKGHPIRNRNWMKTLGAFLALLLFFFLCETYSWPLFRKFNEGTLFGRISNSELFVEWFTPYNTPQFNLFTAFFAITLLPSALIGAVKDIFSRE